jgi:hypothetical protein
LVDEIFGILIGTPKQIPLDDKSAPSDRFAATLADKNPPYRLFTSLRLSLGANPSLGAVSRLHLAAEQKCLLPDV